MTYKKRGQAWGIDLMIAMTLFSLAFLLIFIFSVNLSVQESIHFDSIKEDGENIINNILSQGYPNDWNIVNVKKIGILSLDDKINETKLNYFYQLCKDNYNQTKVMFKTKYNYIFFFENIKINDEPISGIGANVSIENINSSNLVKISRISIYEGRPINVYLYVWD